MENPMDPKRPILETNVCTINEGSVAEKM